MANPNAWYENREQLTDFAIVLDESGEFEDNEELFYYLRNPWKWNDDHKEWVEADSPMPNDDGFDDWAKNRETET